MNSKLSGFLTIGQKTIAAAAVVVQKLMSQLGDDSTLKSTTSYLPTNF